MSKKSASEKRKAKKQKAISQGSPSALRTLAQRNPEAGARAILRALQTAPSTTSDPDVAALAEDLCERLRAEDAFDLSLQLASAFHRRTPRFCLEEALAAFALGDDERAKDAAASAEAVQSALAGVVDLDDEEALLSSPVIERDTVVPVERTRTYYTVVENQPAVRIPVTQGEEEYVDDNTYLGEVWVEDLPPVPASSPVEVTFQLDLSGVLHVLAKHVPSGKSANVTFRDSPWLRKLEGASQNNVPILGAHTLRGASSEEALLVRRVTPLPLPSMT